MMDSTTPNEEASRQECSEAVAREHRSKYRLADLLANTEYPVTGTAREWLDASPVGRELI